MTVPPITVLIVDDHLLLLEMLQQRLSKEKGIDVVSIAEDGVAAIKEAARCRPDILLMDIDMPGISAFSAALEIKVISPATRIIFLSAYLNDSYISQALEVESAGYIIKEHSLIHLLEAIEIVHSGGNYFSPEVQARLVIDKSGVSLADEHKVNLQLLTQRELEILADLAKGLHKKEIAKKMQISPKTVDKHCSHIMLKLDLHDRVDLTRFAIREGLIDPYDD
jgi:DNA-binding NarL/FixJ family response regulator